ncbi:MAG TPA: histone deacetylase, partial [Solirubrobacterales bacterium]|nr:histone deacetylase [Solirubrobacterales bacterium]
MRLTTAGASRKLGALLYFSDPSSLEHDPLEAMPGHPEQPERLRAIERRLAAEDWLGWERRPAPAASSAELRLVHTARHVAAIREMSEAGGGAVDGETWDGPNSYRAAAHAAGGAMALARALLAGEARTGFSAARPPGHHAEPERAMGFCLFDSIAVAAAHAVAELGAARVLILDWDVHHGNGTEAIFRDRDDVLLITIQEEGIWPGTG